MQLDLTALKAAVAQETTVDQSAITLIQGIATQLNNLVAGGQQTVNPADVAAIVTQLQAGTKALADAVTANTALVNPPAPPPPATPPTA